MYETAPVAVALRALDAPTLLARALILKQHLMTPSSRHHDVLADVVGRPRRRWKGAG
jgi:hypothetical protein